MFFCPLSIAIISLWEERANLSALRTFFFFFFFFVVVVVDLRLFGFICSSSSWCLGSTAACDCGTPWTFLLPFLGHYHWEISILLCSEHRCDLRTIVLIVIEYPNDHNEKKTYQFMFSGLIYD